MLISENPLSLDAGGRGAHSRSLSRPSAGVAWGLLTGERTGAEATGLKERGHEF